MKSRPHFIPCMLGAMAVVVLGSWLLNLYGVGQVQSLLSEDGLRHEARTAIRQYMACPELALFVVLAPGLGVAWGSGWLPAVRSLVLHRGRLTRRQYRSMNWAASVLCILLGLMLLTVYGPWATLRGVSGTLWPSPFVQGLPLFLSFALALIGGIYGYTAGRFQRYADLRRSLTVVWRRGALYPVYLFFLVRLFGQLAYTQIPSEAGIPADVMVYTFHLFALALIKFI